MNGEIGTGDTLGHTLMDSVPVGDCRLHKLSGSDLGLAVTRNISHTHPLICLTLCLPLTQYYPAHHSSHVILLRDTNWTPSQHGCQGTRVIFHPSLHIIERERKGAMKKANGNLFLQSPHSQKKAAPQPVVTCRGVMSIVSSLRLAPVAPIRPNRRPSGAGSIRPSLTRCSIGHRWWLSCIWSRGVTPISDIASIRSAWLLVSSWVAL